MHTLNLLLPNNDNKKTKLYLYDFMVFCCPVLVFKLHYGRLQTVLSERALFDIVFFLYFLVDKGREDPSTTISGPSLARQQNAI